MARSLKFGLKIFARQLKFFFELLKSFLPTITSDNKMNGDFFTLSCRLRFEFFSLWLQNLINISISSLLDGL